ncbi:MAG: 2,5-dihydroxypyridine 5,6-dioxygenase [Gaiellales bacterium]|jgi:2,5-dihydroxypyridine 5,6-dioxygenase|nr:2,5-dihydroxypyridine 5,6-dioxygenase [Gaiellales bacterium]
MSEWRWIEVFARHLRACALSHGEVVALLSESSSRPELVETSRIAAQMLGGRIYDIVVPTPASTGAVPVRSTGSSLALAGNRGAIAGLAAADLVIDCTVEGLLHAPELAEILGAGARVLMISNEHPENFERYAEDPTLEVRVERGVSLLESASEMRVTSAAGTDLLTRLAGAFRAGSSGLACDPGTIAHWPGGLCLAFPAAHCVEGVVVLAPGDINLTFKTYVRDAVRLTIEDDHVVAIAGAGLDAELFRSYLAAFGDRASYAVSHVGFGMNRHARWDYLELYDKGQINGTEARAFAGNFLFSTGANENAGRFTAGHFDLPLRGCTIALDGRVVVDAGVLQGELA